MKTIEQYIEAEMADEISCKKDTIVSLSVLVFGIAMWVLLCFTRMSSGLTHACLFFALICTVVGMILTGMCLSGILSHYVYLPTHSRMREKRVYINNIDYSQFVDALAQNECSNIKTTTKLLWPLSNSNYAIRIFFSHDKVCALVQAGRNYRGYFEPETDVRLLTCTEVSSILPLLKKHISCF